MTASTPPSPETALPETGAALRFRQDVAPRDIANIETLIRKTGVFSEEEARTAGELAQETLEKGAGASGYHFILAETGRMPERRPAGPEQALAGYVCYGPVPLTQSVYDLYWIAVSPENQAAGLARALQEQAERHIASLGGSQIFAETSSLPGYEAARRFYRRMGYEEAARFADFYKPGDDKVIFRKRL